jgi:transposase
LLKHSKTDAVDADTLAQYAERMPYQPWVRPTAEALTLRAFSRRINAITKDKAAAKNQLHASTFSAEEPKAVLRELKLSIAQMEKRIARLSAEGKTFILAHPALAKPFALLLTINGIGDTSAIALLGELMLLPVGLTHKQWVKFAGLDPRHFKSGSSVEKRARISKAGNRYIRQALYMPALSAKAHDPHVKGFFDHLIANSKTPLQGVCAVMRKLLHAIHGMFANHQPFDHSRFYKLPT